MALAGDDLDGHSLQRRYEDETYVRIMIRRTDSTAYPSGWHYALHYGAVDPSAVAVPTLDDGTIRRYDNAHEDTKGHELHVAPDPEPRPIDFPGIVELYVRFWDEIPKPREDP
ncbi:toxin-antitoxin system TumE family protein [Halosimplex pelagicum]|uniref:Uncharacterized protein n=1 Tax=Halosimplex pelagicum TaxID=869886 RepID=A0A7D5T8P8_9EURY|nr:DUF6516 family protein [Halosimplex pelagicum]QLH81170.1 hypothetical protein HZS54_05725 [Halosimplex pelagicum]